MPTFDLISEVTVSAHTKVIADNLKEAISLAKLRDATIGGNGSGASEYEQWLVEEIDGLAQNICEE